VTPAHTLTSPEISVFAEAPEPDTDELPADAAESPPEDACWLLAEPWSGVEDPPDPDSLELADSWDALVLPLPLLPHAAIVIADATTSAVTRDLAVLL